MTDAIESLCHVGIIHPMAYPEAAKGEGPIVLDSLEAILRDDFFTAVEITRIKDPQARKQARQMLDTAHVEVIFAGQPPLLGQKLSLNDLDDAGRKKAIEECKVSVDMAYEMGARIMAVLSGPDPGDADRPRAMELLADSLQQVCAYAQEKGEDYQLAVSLENFDRTIDKRCLIGPTDHAAKVAEAVKEANSNFGLTIDLSHLPLLGETPHDMVIAAIDHLIHVHIGNCLMTEKEHPAYGDMHPRFGIPGGDNDVAEVTRFIEALIYGGYFKKNVPTSRPVVSFEVKPLPGEKPELVIANAKRVLREAWARLGQG
ncbi:MAG: sugar phosphate isomerase/epimerase [Armatimonadota bacterium]|nr:MAG: sugar phosphate isomerase/epimerase [Armatimonadota bacterium]